MDTKKDKKFKQYKDLDELAKAMNISKKKIIDFMTYCYDLTQQV